MAYYSHYTSAPHWGTSQYQFYSPPPPTYQPQPSWGGLDFYKAHAGNVFDSSLYDQIWPRARSFSIGSGLGIGLSEAQYWHRRIYGGLCDIRTTLPSDIGAAAAFEAWRNWESHNSVFAMPLSGDRERMREALVGLAIAEASRLWQATVRISDRIGLTEACEMAALTISRIFLETLSVGGTRVTSSLGLGVGTPTPIGGLSPAMRTPPIAPPQLPPALPLGGSASSATLAPPMFTRRRSASLGALTLSREYIPRAVTPVPPTAGLPLDYPGIETAPYYAGRSTGGIGMAGSSMYPYGYSTGGYNVSQPLPQPQIVIPPRRPRSRHRHRHHHHRHWSHSSHRHRGHGVGDALAYNAGMALGGRHGSGLLGNAAVGYAARHGYGENPYGAYGGGYGMY